MTFVYPQVLWAFLALSIPIIIHFFSFRKVKVIEFSTIQFLKNVEQKTRNKRKIKHWLVLLSRLLFMTFLILAFAQPVWDEEKDLSNRTILFVDNSYSMSNEVAEGQDAFAEAIVMAESIVENKPFETQFQLITHDSYNIVDGWSSASSVRESLTEIELTSNEFSFDKLIQQFEGRTEGSEIFVLSDFQKSQYDLSRLSQFEDLNLNAIPLRYNSTRNLYVDSVYLDIPVILRGQRNKLNIIIRNSGDESVPETQLKLTAGSQLIGTTAVEVAARATRLVSFQLDVDNINSDQLSIEIQDFPVTFDNDHFLVLERSKVIRVTVVSENAESTYFRPVFANEDLFDLEVYDPTGIDYERINRSDLLVIEGFSSIPGWMNNIKNADIVVIPSKDIDRDAYASFLGRPVSNDKEAKTQGLKIVDSESPYFSGVFNDEQDQMRDLPEGKVRFAVSDPSAVLLSTSFNKPYLSIFQQQNQIYFLGSPLDQESTNLATHSIFVPLMYRIAQQSGAVQKQLAYVPAAGFVRIPNIVDEVKQIELAGPKRTFSPNFRKTGTTLLVELPPENLDPGFYYLSTGQDTLKTIAINLSKNESDLSQYEISELRSNIEGISGTNVYEAASSLSLSDEIAAEAGKWKLWKLALILAILFVMVEIALIRFIK